MTSPSHLPTKIEYHIITPTGRHAHIFDNKVRAQNYYGILGLPEWRLVEVKTTYKDISPVLVDA
jgi:hypothetical protein